MTSEKRRHLMCLLRHAKEGDEQACGQLCAELTRHFKYMVLGYSTSDPAIDRDDILAWFTMGIWQHIAKADGRGDPLYHLAWRGQLTVRSMLATIKARRSGTEAWVRERGYEISVGTLPEYFDLPDERPEADPEHQLVIEASQQEARDHVAYLIEHAQLGERQRDVVRWMLTVPYANEGRANVRLAQAMDTSPQAASRNRRVALEALSGMDHGSTAVIQCEDCGRDFKSKGALTQHKRGQSGHRPCPAQVAS